MTQENGCGRGNEALCRSVFIIFVLRKEDWIMKRMIAAILVLCMVLCSIPVAAAASFDEFFADVEFVKTYFPDFRLPGIAE